MIDIGKGGYPRFAFESILWNRRLFLVDGPAVFVSSEDWDRCWPESPWDMREKGYTLRVTFKARPLLFGGYGPAEITNVRRVEDSPTITKYLVARVVLLGRCPDL